MLTVYAVRNSDGKYFRSVGYGGYGKQWVEDLESARLYQKLSTARSRVTYYATSWPDYPAPEIIAFTCSKPRVLDESERLGHVLEKRKTKAERDAVKQAKAILKRAEAEMKRAAENLSKAQQSAVL